MKKLTQAEEQIMQALWALDKGGFIKDILEVLVSFFPEEGKTPQQIKELKEPVEKVAVFAEKNLYWRDLGALEKGYNIISKEKSEKWITHKAVRIASPEEVASYYGIKK